MEAELTFYERELSDLREIPRFMALKAFDWLVRCEKEKHGIIRIDESTRTKSAHKTYYCYGRSFDEAYTLSGGAISRSYYDKVCKEHPANMRNGIICVDDWHTDPFVEKRAFTIFIMQSTYDDIQFDRDVIKTAFNICGFTVTPSKLHIGLDVVFNYGSGINEIVLASNVSQEVLSMLQRLLIRWFGRHCPESVWLKTGITPTALGLRAPVEDFKKIVCTHDISKGKYTTTIGHRSFKRLFD